MDTRKLLTYTKSERNVYLISLSGQNIIYSTIGAGLAYFLQFSIYIPAIAIGVIMAIARVWDAVNDFMMGTIVDKTRTRWGKCRPFLIFIPLPISILTVLCFVNFGFYGETTRIMDIIIVGWAALVYILWGMMYTVGDIPLWGATALMTEDPKDRNKLISLARIVSNAVGGLSSTAIVPAALYVGQVLSDPLGSIENGERWGFFVIALIFTIIGFALFQIAGFKIKERVQSPNRSYGLKSNYKIIKENKPFKQILFSGILGSPKMLVMFAQMPLITYYFATKDPLMSIFYMAFLGGGSFIGMFLGMSFAVKLKTRYSTKKLYNYSNLIASIPFALVFVLYLLAPRGMLATSPIFLIIFLILFIITGAANGITTVLQSTMIADCIDYEEHKTGSRPDGVFFAGQTFLAKLTTGIATILSGIAFHIVGFSDTNVRELNHYIETMGENDPLPREMAMYDKYMMILFFMVSIPPAIGCILSIIPTLKYALNDEVHAKIIKELNERRHSINS